MFVVPNNNLTQSLGCQHLWSNTQLCWQVVKNKWGETNMPGIAVAGDGGRINGALAAEHQGRVTGLGALFRLGILSKNASDNEAQASNTIIEQQTNFRVFLDTLFQPTKTFRIPDDDNTVVCRCELVTAGDIKEMIKLGCTAPNQCKSYSRCGMGPCQGRFCGLTVSEMIADTINKPTQEVGY